jgi:hypothetical protein
MRFPFGRGKHLRITQAFICVLLLLEIVIINNDDEDDNATGWEQGIRYWNRETLHIKKNLKWNFVTKLAIDEF